MTATKPPKSPLKETGRQARERRLAEALRENLKKRKAQPKKERPGPS